MATAAITGTILSTAAPESVIVAGGKTIIITLTGDTWVAAGATFDAQRQNIINGLNAGSSPASGWTNQVRANLAVTTVVRTSATVVTITLSAQAAYAISAFETITVTIPSTALTGAVAIVASNQFWVYDAAQTFYIRKTGSDSNSGASASQAWLTIGKALGAAGIFSGATCWIGAGVYREVVTCNLTSPTATTNIYGDVTGANTGDAGEVRWTAYTTNDYTAPSGTSLLTMNGRDFLRFQNIIMIGGSAIIVDATTATSTDITFYGIAFQAGGTMTVGLLSYITGANITANWTIDSCVFMKAGNSAQAISIQLTRPVSADFDYVITIKNCIFIGGQGTSINITSTGANSFNGGGVLIYNCSNFSNGVFTNTGSNISTSIPSKVYNCLICVGTSGLSATSLGSLIEDYNIINAGTARTNVAIGTHSVSDGSIAPSFYTGIEYLQRGLIFPFGMPILGSPLFSYGNQSGSPAIDIVNVNRPSQSTFIISDYGTATAGAARTLTNTNRNWGVNAYAGYTLYIVSGAGSGQSKSITSNTTTVITVDGNWNTNPDNTSIYQVYAIPRATSGKATAGAATTMTDGNAAWGTNMWQGFILSIDSGTGSGQTKTIVSNTGTVITVSTWGTNPDNTSVYSIYKLTNTTTIAPGVGVFESFVDKKYALKRTQRRKNLNTFKI